MTNDIYRNPNDSQGWRMMLQFGLGGLALLGVGLAMPTLLTGLFAGAGDPGAAKGAAGIVSWLAVALGALLLVLAGLAGLFWGPFRTVQQKYGTLGAIALFAPGLLLFAAILAMALQ